MGFDKYSVFRRLCVVCVFWWCGDLYLTYLFFLLFFFVLVCFAGIHIDFFGRGTPMNPGMKDIGIENRAPLSFRLKGTEASNPKLNHNVRNQKGGTMAFVDYGLGTETRPNQDWDNCVLGHVRHGVTQPSLYRAGRGGHDSKKYFTFCLCDWKNNPIRTTQNPNSTLFDPQAFLFRDLNGGGDVDTHFEFIQSPDKTKILPAS